MISSWSAREFFDVNLHQFALARCGMHVIRDAPRDYSLLACAVQAALIIARKGRAEVDNVGDRLRGIRNGDAVMVAGVS